MASKTQVVTIFSLLSLLGLVLADDLCPSTKQKINIGESYDTVYAQVTKCWRTDDPPPYSRLLILNMLCYRYCGYNWQACNGKLTCQNTFSGLPDPFFAYSSFNMSVKSNPVCLLSVNSPLQISDGNTRTYVGSCVVANSTAANAALSAMNGFQIVGHGGNSGCPCQAVPDPSQGFVIGLKLYARVSLRNGAIDYTYFLKGCDATFTYRSTALANGETFMLSVDVISHAITHSISWFVLLGCIVSLLSAAF